MKIAHILTYVSADAAFGGPVAVAVAQTKELATRGHHVEIFAGWDGNVEFSVPGVGINLFKVTKAIPAGFSGLIAPALIREVRRRSAEFDVIHVHLARDLVTTPAALAVLAGKNGTRLFVQSHGMVKPDYRIRSRVFDYAIRSILRRCQSVFALNDVDAERILAVAGEPISVLELPNGVNSQPVRDYLPNNPREVLFLARLHKRKRVMVFAEAAATLLKESAGLRFTVVGPDEGDLPELISFIQAEGLAHGLAYEGVVEPGTAPARIRNADLYVLPSLDEPFPMSVLESLSVGTPTVVSSSCHIARELVEEDATIAFADAAEGLANVLRNLLSDTAMLKQLSANGQSVINRRYGSAHVADLLETFYPCDRGSLRNHGHQYSQGGQQL